jgi:acyl dehydratase
MAEPIVIGEYTEWVEGEVDADAALAYALASNDPNEVLRRGEAVPPLFMSSLVLPVMNHATRRSVPKSAVTGPRGGVHGEHQVFFRRHLRPGQAVRMRANVHSARQTPAGALVAVEVDVCDLDGALLVRHYWVNLRTGCTLVDGAVGPDLPPHAFPARARERHFASYSVYVDADQGFRYAGASGDRPPHAISDERAKLEGYPGKILQGMCTFALASGGVVKVGGESDPLRLVRIAARFARPCRPKHELQVEMYDGGRSEAGNQLVIWEAVSDGVTVIKHGLAEFTPE